MKRIIVLLLISSLLVGCSGGFSGIMSNSQGTSDYDPHQGNQGLEIRFVKDNPPLTVYQTEQGTTYFPMLIEVWNRGAADLDTAHPGYLYISGFDRNIITGNFPSYKPLHEPPLTGKSAYSSVGGYRVVDMSCAGTSCADPQAMVSMDASVSEYKPRIQVTACYSYETMASPAVCIDGNPYTGIEDKPCKVGQVKGTGSQGAPVAISNIEEIAMPGSVQFRIHVSNVGGGKVVRSDTIRASTGTYAQNTCPHTLGFEDMNQISYSVNLQGSTGSECEPSITDFRLVDGRGVIFCTFTINTQETYLAPLQINLQYGYMQSFSQEVTIRNLGT